MQCLSMEFYLTLRCGTPYKKKNFEELEVIDQQLMRHIIGAHSKPPTEFLYLETATVPLKYVISCRRMIYLKNILQR